MTYLDALGLSEPPFSKEITDADLWLPTSKQLIADGLLEALTERASVLLVGEPGVGKTCVLRALRHRVAAAGYRLTYSHNATLRTPRLLPPALPRPRPRARRHRTPLRSAHH